MDFKKEIIKLGDKYFSEIRDIRRHLHMYPELSFREEKTSQYIQNELKKTGLEYQEIFKTGITGILKGRNPQKKTIALRADIDALPVQENTGLEFASKNPGVMHACGHDAHTAILLGTLKILSQLKEQLEGQVKFIFQPAEEKLPGGAYHLIKEGVLENPRPDVIIGQHVYPDLPAGYIGFKPGAYMASSDEIFLTVQGKGGHGAMPHKITDTVLLASQIITTLHQAIPRSAPTLVPTVLSFGKIRAEGATNVIPDQVDIEGTFRTMDEKWRNEAHTKIRKTAQQLAENIGAQCRVEIKKGYPVLINDEFYTSHAIEAVKNLWGNEKVKELDKRMTAEDFAYYSQIVPGVFYRLGTGYGNSNNPPPLHSSEFTIDENALKTGMSTMAWLAVEMLSK